MSENLVEESVKPFLVPSKKVRDKKDTGVWRDLTAYWFFGLCNNYGYVIMLTAAFDVLRELEQIQGEVTEDQPNIEGRSCNLMSTGAILLANTVPSIILKLAIPFLPFLIRVRVITSCLLVAIGLVSVAFAQTKWVALTGVACAAMSCELGETSFLAYSSNFNRNVISTWASGTGGAGVVGAISYTLLRIIFNKQQTILLMLVVPIFELLIFFFLLRKPNPDADQTDKLDKEKEQEDLEADIKPLVTFKEKVFYIKNLFIYIIPLTSIFVFEYFINQGLYELIHFDNTFLTMEEQYRWYQVIFQVGMFLSRSSANLFQIKQIWLLSVIQLLNTSYFFFESIYSFTPSIWIIFGLILAEGLFGGWAYVNTYFTRIRREIPLIHREFAFSVVAVSGTSGIALAGFMAIPTHNWICKLPAPSRI